MHLHAVFNCSFQLIGSSWPRHIGYMYVTVCRQKVCIIFLRALLNLVLTVLTLTGEVISGVAVD